MRPIRRLAPRTLPRSVLGGLALTVLTVALAPSGLAAQDVDDRPIVAVVRFDNNTGDAQYEHLGRAFSSMMISDLSVIDRIRLVERERIEELMAELDLQQSAYSDPESAVTMGMILGAQYMVLGAFVTVDPQMRMDSRVARTETAEIVTTAEATGEQTTLFDLQQALADQLIEGLDIVLTEEERQRLREQQEANRIDDVETVVAFSNALCLLDYGDYVDAFEEIQVVAQAAPSSAIVRATMDVMRDKAEDAAADRLRNEANRRIGGLIGRRSRNAQPTRPVNC